MIEQNIAPLRKAEAEEFARDVEGGGDDAVERQIGFERGFIDVEQRFAPPLRVIAPIPRRQFEIAAFFGDDRLKGGGVAQRLFAGGREDAVKQIMRRLRRLGHRVVKTKMGEAFIAQKLGALGAQAHHLRRDGAIIMRPRSAAARREGAKRFFAQIAPRRLFEERLKAGARKGHHMLSGMAARCCALRRRPEEGGRQAKAIGFVFEDQAPGFFVGQNILAEGGAKAGEAFADFLQARLCGGR